MQESAFESTMAMGSITTEEGTILGRIKQPFNMTEAIGAAKVNGPTGDKGQYVWMGTYTVKLDRGLTLDSVQHICGFGSTGGQAMRCLAYGERVSVTWLNKNNVQMPIILDGTTLDFYNKLVGGSGILLDPGEQIIRAGMAPSPGATGDFPFADNQFDNPNSVPGLGNPDSSKLISKPGGETFYDKMGRIISLSRFPGKEFLVTTGKVDTGQDDVSTLKTVAEQDVYYGKMLNDESRPLVAAEPAAPKPLNLSQYQLTKVVCKIQDDPDPNRTVVRGILPRFDKWQFEKILIRKYAADSDGALESGDTYSVYQQRANSSADGKVLGYVRTTTDQGDIKEFVPRHYNGRVVGDHLLSVGGNYDLRIKTTAMKADGSVNPINLVHQEFLADGTVKFNVNQDISAKTATFSSTITSDGSSTTTMEKTMSVTSKGEMVIDSLNDIIYLGGKTGSQFMVMGDNLKKVVDDLYTALNTWIPAPGDGGAALKVALATFFTDYAQALSPGQTNYYLSQNQKVA